MNPTYAAFSTGSTIYYLSLLQLYPAIRDIAAELQVFAGCLPALFALPKHY
jgi:hypothetical protein